jgi:hypothetical protein
MAGIVPPAPGAVGDGTVTPREGWRGADPLEAGEQGTQDHSGEQ